MDKRGFVWIIFAILYIIYSALIVKHGFMFINTSVTIAMFIIGGYYLFKK